MLQATFTQHLDTRELWVSPFDKFHLATFRLAIETNSRRAGISTASQEQDTHTRTRIHTYTHTHTWRDKACLLPTYSFRYATADAFNGINRTNTDRQTDRKTDTTKTRSQPATWPDHVIDFVEARIFLLKKVTNEHEKKALPTGLKIRGSCFFTNQLRSDHLGWERHCIIDLNRASVDEFWKLISRLERYARSMNFVVSWRKLCKTAARGNLTHLDFQLINIFCSSQGASCYDFSSDLKGILEI